jgi:hypothetical protein
VLLNKNTPLSTPSGIATELSMATKDQDNQSTEPVFPPPTLDFYVMP